MQSDLQKGRDDDRVRDVQRLLGLDNFSEELQRESLQRYHHLLAYDDQLGVEYLQQMRGLELDSFRCKPDYQRWLTSPKPCFLILSGYNNESVLSARQCWLSPVATTLIGDLTNADTCSTVAYSIIPPSGILVYDILPAILLQLLRQKRQALRDEKQYSELQSGLRDFQVEVKGNTSSETHEIKLAALLRVASRVISFFDESETVYIIVDRADRCRDLARADHRMVLLRAFVKLVEIARSKLKILAVLNGYDWPDSKDLNDLREKVEDRIIIRRVEQKYIS